MTICCAGGDFLLAGSSWEALLPVLGSGSSAVKGRSRGGTREAEGACGFVLLRTGV